MSFRPKRGKPEYLEGSCARPELVLILAPSLSARGMTLFSRDDAMPLSDAKGAQVFCVGSLDTCGHCTVSQKQWAYLKPEGSHKAMRSVPRSPGSSL